MRRTLFLALAIATVSVAKAQEVVYNNTTTSLNNNMPLLPEWLNDSAEVGDDIYLGGTARSVVELKLIFNYRGTLPGTIDAKLRFRGLQGSPQTPGAAFWESALLTSIPTVSGINEYTFAIPNVVVPDHFVWTIEATNRQGSVGELGPAYFNPATIGHSDDFFWQSDHGSEWIGYNWGGDPYANFGARVTAVPVPEPASLIAIASGFAVLLRRRKR